MHVNIIFIHTHNYSIQRPVHIIYTYAQTTGINLVCSFFAGGSFSIKNSPYSTLEMELHRLPLWSKIQADIDNGKPSHSSQSG